MQDRPSKKQRELLSFIENFVAGHGYGPSYREIMRGMGYKSVSTVQLHIENLIAKGLLKKRENSARSLEVVDSDDESFKTNKVKPADEKWLVGQVELKFETTESLEQITSASLDDLQNLINTLTILGFDSAAKNFLLRIAELKKRVSD